MTSRSPVGLLLLFAVAALVGSTAASAAPARVTIFPEEMNISSLSCLTEHRCVAYGNARHFSFRPAAPGKPVFPRFDPQAIEAAGSPAYTACASVTQCTYFGSLGGAVTFDPRRSSQTMPYGKVATDDEWVSGVCPSVRLCVAFTTPTRPDRPKEPALFTFDPRTFATGPRTTISVGALHCVSASQCTLVTSETSQSGNSVALTFDPAAPATQRRVVLPASVEAGQLDCPTTHQCTTVGVDVSDRTALRYVAVTFAPGGAVLPPVDLGPRKTVWPPLNVSCPTAGQCTVGGANKRTLTTFNPRRPEARRIHRFLSDKRLGDDSYLGFVSCPSAKLCVAGGADPEQHGFDLEGEALLVAFDPRTGRAPRFP